MPYAASLTTHGDAVAAVDALTQDVLRQLDGARPDLVFVFFSAHYVDEAEQVSAALMEKLGCRHLIGCNGEAIAGGKREIENGPAMSLWAAVLPEAQFEAFHVRFERTPDGLLCHGLPDLSLAAVPPQAMFLLGDPYSCAVNVILERLTEEAGAVPLFGGMASGGAGPGLNRLFLDGAVHDHGGVGVVITGGPSIASVVSQGCRPIGTTLVVTKSEQNVIYQLGGKPPVVRLQEVYSDLPQKDRELMQRGLHVGIVMNEYQETFQRGDFLISNVLGLDKDSGAVVIGNHIRTGQTVQFHLRDAESADEDLRHLLSHRMSALPKVRAALLFTCNGRGTRLFNEPHHDAATIQDICGTLPLAGFFAQGELGPVGSKNYIHGFTASIALFGE